MSEQAYDPEALRSALEHIAASARNSRSSTRRIRWIERRAEMALAGEPYSNEACGDMPKSAGDTAEKARQMMLRERAAAAEALSVLQKQLEEAQAIISLLRDEAAARTSDACDIAVQLDKYRADAERLNWLEARRPNLRADIDAARASLSSEKQHG